jgi:hypothetical protein
MAPHKLVIRCHGGIFDITVAISHDRDNRFKFRVLISRNCDLFRV